MRLAAAYPNPDLTALARYTQRPPPVAIPPNSIGLTYLHSFLSTDECAKLIELSESSSTAQSPTELIPSVVIDGSRARSAPPRL